MKILGWLVRLDCSPWDSKRVSIIANLFLALVLCSKFYYLWGTIDGLAPKAPVFIILIRDLIIFGFLIFSGWIGRRFFKELKFFWILLLIGLFFSLIQLWGEKSFATWGQHYIRNVLVPLLFYPAVYGLLRAKVEIKIEKILQVIFWMNLIFCYIQLAQSSSVRPSGIFGDAILGCTMLLLGLSSVLVHQGMVLRIVSILAATPIIYAMSSVSAVASVSLAVFVVAGISIQQKRYKVRFYLQMVVPLILLAALSWWAVGKTSLISGEGIGNKVQYLYEAATCRGACWQNWSYKGRVVSNQRPFFLCQEDFTSCVIGNYSVSTYERIESTWASLWVNWGSIFCILYLVWVFRHFSIYWHFRADSRSTIWTLIFWTGAAFLTLNVIIYRLPINVLFYGSMAYFKFRAFQREKRG